MGQYFNKEMTRYEARSRLWEVLEGKSKEEEEEIIKEYREILPQITARYSKLQEQGWLIDDL